MGINAESKQESETVPVTFLGSSTLAYSPMMHPVIDVGETHNTRTKEAITLNQPERIARFYNMLTQEGDRNILKS